MQEPMQNSLPRQLLAGAQMLFVAFGALVLMPLITGMDPNVALFTAGIGTLLFQLVTGRQVPVFLASSFAFIAPILAAKTAFGMPAVMGGIIAAGFMYAAQSGRAAARGRLYRALAAAGGYCAGDYVLPGTVATAVNMAMATGDGATQLIEYSTAMIISMSALCSTWLWQYWVVACSGWCRFWPESLSAPYCHWCWVSLRQPLLWPPWLAMPAFVAPGFTWSHPLSAGGTGASH